MFLWNVKGCEFGNSAFSQSGVWLAFVAAVGGVGFEDVAVSGFQFFQDAAFVDYTGATVVGECAEKNGVFTVLRVEGAELGEVFAEQCVSLCLGQLYASAVWFARLDLMTVADIGPMLRLMERLKLFDNQDCPLKERQFHYTSVLSLLRSESASR